MFTLNFPGFNVITIFKKYLEMNLPYLYFIVLFSVLYSIVYFLFYPLLSKSFLFYIFPQPNLIVPYIYSV